MFPDLGPLNCRWQWQVYESTCLYHSEHKFNKTLILKVNKIEDSLLQKADIILIFSISKKPSIAFGYFKAKFLLPKILQKKNKSRTEGC